MQTYLKSQSLQTQAHIRSHTKKQTKTKKLKCGQVSLLVLLFLFLLFLFFLSFSLFSLVLLDQLLNFLQLQHLDAGLAVLAGQGGDLHWNRQAGTDCKESVSVSGNLRSKTLNRAFVLILQGKIMCLVCVSSGGSERFKNTMLWLRYLTCTKSCS